MEAKYLARVNGPPLFYRKWRSASQPRTSVPRRAVFIGHSQPTHSGMLSDLAEGFRAAGWDAHSGDIRGHGKSTDTRVPLGHLNTGDGWSLAVDDMRHLLERSFDGVDWADRLVVVPNITALMTLEVMKTWHDLARHIVLISPVPNQRTLALFGKAFSKVRMRLRAADQPDEQILHHLYAFLGAHLRDREHPADVISTDRDLIREIVSDPEGWPIPSPAYWSNIFSGMLSAWKWPNNARLKPGTRVLVMFGGEDAMLRDGGFLPPIERFLAEVGVENVAAERVEGVRSGLFLEERRFGISKRILDWVGQDGAATADARYSEVDVAQLASDVIARLGGGAAPADMRPDELVELCYNAIDDETRWTEVIYRIIYEAEQDGEMTEAELAERIERLMPHWERAFSLNRQVMMNATLGVLLQAVIDKLQIGIAILDADGALLHANTTYRETLLRIFPKTSPGTDGDAFSAAATRRLFVSGAAAEDTGKVNNDRIVLHDNAPVGFHFHPQALRQTGLQRQGPASILILRATERDDDDNTRRVLTELAYGLTGKEAEIALLIAEGMSLDEIAGELGILVSTARGHLKKAFQKMTVHSQAELTARIMSGPVGWLK